MKILRMQATFGTLDARTLELHDGLNVITAPNESGKSTWCAFLLAMLYGIDTAQRSSKDVIADKIRYQSWNGKPMAGRLDLEWQGRRITIERAAKGRIPLGEFRAYETDSGAPVRELTALNCGQLLTGAPRSVFERSAFLRQAGHAVTFDAALEQMLQELVTTGDEQVAYQPAMQQLQQLKNRCQHNKTGLIPQVEQELTQTNDILAQMDALDGEVEAAAAQLAVCQAADREKSQQQDEKNQATLEQAKLQWEQSRQSAQALRQQVETLPGEETLDAWQNRLRTLLEEQRLPEEAPLAPPALQNMTPPEAAAAARRDSELAKELEDAAPPRLWVRLLPLILLAGAVWLRRELWAVLLCGSIGIGVTVVGLLLWLWRNKRYQQKQTELRALLNRYQVSSAEQMMQQAREYLQQLRAWQERRERGDSRNQEAQQALLREISAVLPVNQLSDAAEALQQVRLDHMKWKNAEQRSQTARLHYEQLAEAIGPVEQTVGVQTQQLSQQLAELRGRLAALGDRDALTQTAQALSTRLTALREYDAAIGLAMTALTESMQQLQARFAPPLRQKTMEYLRQLTDGAHEQLTIDRQMQLTLCEAGEPVGHPSGYYSCGTRDQIYLALRLAIAALLLTGDCPVVLDDALVCFDDQRLRCALELLTQLSKQRQILLFSCQSREETLLKTL